MDFKFGKMDFLDNRMFSLWPTYLSTESVPDEIKNQVNTDDGFVFMANILGNPNSLQAWNGNSWIIIAEANGAIVPIGPESGKPSTPVEADLYFSTDSNTLQVYNGTKWQRCSGGAFSQTGTYNDRPSSPVDGEIYTLGTGGTIFWDGDFWQSGSVLAESSAPTVNGDFAGQLNFSTVLGELYCWTGSNWYKFTGTLVT
jgi:hypothetical protein